MSNPGWKQFERKLAKDIGTTRIPVTGIDRHGADLEQAMFCYQAKLRKVIPAFLYEWLGGICASAAAKNKIGVLVVSRPRTDRKDALVIVRWSDWCSLHGTPQVEPPMPTIFEDYDADTKQEPIRFNRRHNDPKPRKVKQ